MPFAFLTENQLDNWVRSESIKSRSRIPTLISDLVARSCPNALERRFPAGDSSDQPGCDGFLRDQNGCLPFVPTGDSCWEIGTGPALKKATDDYRCRTKNTPEDVRHNATLILVNPRSSAKEWRAAQGRDAKEEWLARRKKKNEWKDIKIIDGSIIIDWLTEHPDIGRQLAHEVLGLPRHGIETIEERWKVLQSYGGSNPLTPNLFLDNRDNAVQKLENLLSGIGKSELGLITRFPDQVADFVCAFAASLEDDNRRAMSARTLMISDSNVWSMVCKTNADAGLLLVAEPSLDISGDTGSRMIEVAVANGHSVIYDAPFGGTDDDLTFRLQDPHISDIDEALTSAGFSSHQARTITEKSGRNLTFVLRLIRGRPLEASWANEESSDDLVFALLIGSWDHNSLADREIIQTLTGKNYIEWTRNIRRFANAKDPPVVVTNGWWKFIARFDGWHALGRLFDEDHLDGLHKAATMALCPDRFQLKMTYDECDKARQEGKSFNVSFEILKGLSETLALLGSYPEVTTTLSQRRIEEFVSRIVKEIIHNLNDVEWTALDKILPLLAEASPDTFLDAVNGVVEQDDGFVDRLTSPVSLFANRYDLPIGLSWAIESVAWSQDFLLKACVLLGKLSEPNLKKGESNNSLQSLSRILFPLLPQTMASIHHRMNAVKEVIQSTPQTGWSLLLDLFPSQRRTVIIQNRPVWRKFIPEDWTPTIPLQRDIILQAETLSNLAVDLACEDVEKLTDCLFIDLIPDLTLPAFTRVLSHIESDATASLTTDQQLTLWGQLARLHRKHKEYADASWAMTKDDTAKIEKIVRLIEPRDPRIIVRIVFSNDAFLLTDISDDRDQNDRQIESLRRKTIEDLLGLYNSGEILSIAISVQDSSSFGYHLAEYADFQMDQFLLPAILTPNGNDKLQWFAKKFLARRWDLRQWEWADRLDRSDWTVAHIGVFLSCMPFIPETWSRATAWLDSNEEEYWKRARAWFPRESKEDFDPAIKKLLSYNRPHEAVECLASLHVLEIPYDRHLACQVLLSNQFVSLRPHEDFSYKIRRLIKDIQSNSDIPTRTLLEIEWRHAELLENPLQAVPQTILNHFVSDPSYFYKIAKLRWQHKSIPPESPNREELGQHKIDIISNAYFMLNYEWKTVPGTDLDGKFHPDRFEKWVNEVYQLCDSIDMLEEIQRCLGSVFVHAPADPNGLWIHRTIAKTLDDLNAETMRHSYLFALRNTRGVHTVEGTGVQERKLSETFREKAKQLKSEEFDLLAETLNEVAKSYDWESDNVIRRDDLEDR